jgi:hypothetical protein
MKTLLQTLHLRHKTLSVRSQAGLGFEPCTSVPYPHCVNPGHLAVQAPAPLIVMLVMMVVVVMMMVMMMMIIMTMIMK